MKRSSATNRTFSHDSELEAIRKGSFGLRPGDWLRTPFTAMRYLSLARRERAEVAKSAESFPLISDFSQGWGRYLHILVGIGSLAGVMMHLIQVCPYFAF